MPDYLIAVIENAKRQNSVITVLAQADYKAHINLASWY